MIHLNGPPAIGKSTLAALYADRHPGTLNLDIDRLHAFIGGWQDAEGDQAILRPLARAMASAHLAGERDVVLPQYLALLSEIELFEAAAREQGAEFREIVLLADKDESVARFGRRDDLSEWDEYNRRLVDSLGGEEFLAGMYDRLLAILRARPSAVVVRSEPDAIEDAYAALVRALDADQGRPARRSVQ